ncbi:LacI family DNA-binding transcriptional regulator [Actinophytocola algeriensis]|uniref:DNA-binding LacI/PurR family transcriptional regulator n=1 Tax=Actinophytocola algeriensis TaxID=1768010 RepID=A0A7W7QDB5_9PSEU|nr:LacI family DNA-binding transcriptional regulator [Actinophytocola algeriensis]MBB4911512.1 DNA-binding LacI/PurR family transcriptional regulator [Actinophytocola algeriensis]MBE1473500.1 DNA-binding LacI/PurR family transcriptional regulator [Actinophytocola algeriensis]
MTDTAPQRRARARSKRPPTIHDVAAHAGVSRGTVSRVLQGGDNVSPAAREAVNAAIRKLGYVVNRAARSLVTQRAGSVAFLLSETQDRFFSDPNFTTLLRGCTAALAELDIPLILVTAGSEAERRRITPYLSAHHVDGVLLFSSHRGNPMIDHFLAADLPFVCCGKPLGQRGALSYVAADDREGAKNMVRHLLESGRTRIATIAGPQDTPGGLERLAGYRETLAEHGIAHDKRLVATGDYSRASGESCMYHLLARAPDLDAVFVASDLMADGALTAIQRAGLRVPEDIAVGGFDDSPVAPSTRPPLTTIQQPWDRISKMMVRQLLAQINGEGPATVILPTKLVVRESA